MSRFSGRDTRHAALAHTLHARLYVSCEGRIFAVRGRVAHGKLKRALRAGRPLPDHGASADAAQLGVPECDGELSRHLLHCISRALDRWREQLSTEMKRKAAKRRISTTLAREHQEIARLASRLAALGQWHAELANGKEPAGRRSFSIPLPKRRFRPHWKTHAARTPLPPLVVWQARVVCWLSGHSRHETLFVGGDTMAQRVSQRFLPRAPSQPTCSPLAPGSSGIGGVGRRRWQREPRCPSDAFGKRPGRKTFRSSCGPSKSSPSRSASRATTPCSQPLNNCRRRRRKLNSTRFVSCWHKATRWPTRSGLLSRVCRTASRIQP